MKYKNLLIYLLLCAALHGNNRIDIYLSFNDCVNCYTGLSALETLTSYEKTILISREDSLLSLEFLENYALPKTITYKYLPAKASGFSYCKVLMNNQLVDSFGLQTLQLKAKHMSVRLDENKSITPIKTFALPKNTVLKGDRLDLSVNGNYLNAYDYILNKNIVFTINAAHDTLQKVLELKGQQFPSRSLLTIGRLDSVFYNNCIDLLKKKGKASAHIEGSFLADSTLFLLLNFPWIHVDAQHPNDTVIDVSYFLYERNLFTGAKKLSPVSERSLKESCKNRYDIDNSRPFFVDRSSKKVTFSLLDLKRTDQNLYVLAEFKNTKLGYDFAQLNPLHVDKDYYTNHLIDGYAMYLNRQFYFSIKFKLIVDYLSNTLITLEDYQLPEASFGLDIIKEQEQLKLLVLHNNEIEVMRYDLKKKKTTAGKRTLLPPDCSVSSIRFYNSKTILFLDKAASKVCLMPVAD